MKRTRRERGPAHTPVVFLDIDGVLAPWEANVPEPACVARLNRLVASTGARVVLSSSWRETMLLSAIEAVLRAAGARFALVDATPILPDRTRGEEITAWRRKNDGDAPFVILDDGADVRPYQSRLVRPDAEVGLQDGDVAKAIAILERSR